MCKITTTSGRVHTVTQTFQEIAEQTDANKLRPGWGMLELTPRADRQFNKLYVRIDCIESYEDKEI